MRRSSWCRSCRRFTSGFSIWSSASQVASPAASVVKYVTRRLTASRRMAMESRDRLAAFGGVDDQRDLVVLDHVDDVRTALAHLVDALAGQARCLDHLRRAVGGDDVEAARDQSPRHLHGTGLVALAHAEQRPALARQRRCRSRPAPSHRPRRRCGPCPSPRRWISFPDRGSDRTRGTWRRGTRLPSPSRSSARSLRWRRAPSACGPAITCAPILARGDPVALETKGTVREARGLTSST